MTIPTAIDRAKTVLKENRYFVLATNDGDGPWAAVLAHTLIAPRYLYFFSQASSRHGRALTNRSRVAGVIYDSRCSPAEAESLQFSGFGEIAHDRASIAEVLRLAAVRDGDSPPTEQAIDAAFLKTTTPLYRILIENAYVLDQTLFAQEGIDAREDVDIEEAFRSAT